MGASAVGLQQLLKMQGIKWGDGTNEKHLWIDGDTAIMDGKLASRGPIYFCRAFNYQPDGVTDMAPQIVDAIGAAQTAIAGNGGGAVVLVEPGIAALKSGFDVPTHVTVQGFGRATQLKAVSGWSGTYMVRMGTTGLDTDLIFHSRLDNLYLEGNALVNKGVYSNQMNENCGLWRCVVNAFLDYCCHFAGISGNFMVQDCEIGIWDNADHHGIGVWFDTTNGAVTASMIRNTVGNNALGASAQQTTGVQIETGACVKIFDMHIENYTNGVYFKSGSLGSAIGVNNIAGTGAEVTNLVRLAGSGQIAVADVHGTNGVTTNTILDDTNSATFDTATWPDIAFYTNGTIFGVGGVRTKTTAGAPTGGESGDVAIDTTNSRAYFKVGTTWKYAALT